MSDDFDDDSFMVDDSFLAEVDSIAASASTGTAAAASHSAYNRTTSLPVIGHGVKAAVTTDYARPKSANSTSVAKSPLLPSLNAVAGPSRPPRLAPQPPSDDFDDDFDIPTESLALIDDISAGRPLQPTHSSSSGSSRPAPIPSSRLGMGRTLGRTSSGSGGFQTHLNFRRENQATAGKRWDRTAFAESGRRVDAARSKGQGKDRRFENDDDEVFSEEDDGEDALAPAPKPLVDISRPYGPPKHHIDAEAGLTYIYPTNRSKRDYQYEIVRGCFTDNCLVALPTGLGKTFVAGVVMLNFYRWFPTGKIVFLAPTKPLVNQQIEACQLSCGIPSSDAAVMTGSSVSQKERAKLWNERRVFYCTPQTLDNDLKKGSVDPRDIVLAVFDEAHKASGSYAYTTILAYITAHHPHFRVLALTATPGADVPRVQAVVDALHISRIEIREAEAPEIRKYMNEKHTERHCVAMGAVIEGFRDRWATIMRPNVKKLVDKNVLTERDLDIKRLKPFRLTQKRMEIGRDRTSGLKWCYGSLVQLEKMARAMGHLLEFSMGMFQTALRELAGGQNSSGRKSGTTGGAAALRNNLEFQKLLKDVDQEMNAINGGKGQRTKTDKHPKMGKTLELLYEHFAQAQEDEQLHGIKNDTRAMVFCSFRDCVLEVVDMLNQHDLLKATKFVGQSQGKQEIDKGFNQKEQKKTIQDFKEGKYNILVSTSIGEEGLDIGEVDFVVIYDMPKQSIKLLQRIGRTGRKRNGKVHVLMSENREDTNWDTAQQTHREIQEEILHSRNLELFEDVERLLPPAKFPTCVEQEMPVDPWDPADQKSKRKLPGSQTVKGHKRGRDDDDAPAQSRGKVKKSRGHDIPDDAHDGFVSVAELLKRKGKGKGKGKGQSTRASASPSPDEDDELVLFGQKIAGTGRKRARHTPESSEDDDDEAEQELLYGTVGKGKGPVRKGTSDTKSKGKTAMSKGARETKKAKTAQIKETEEEKKKRLEREDIDKRAIDFFNTYGPTRKRSLATPSVTPPSSPPTRSSVKATHPPPSPSTDGSLEKTAAFGGNGNKLSPSTAAMAGFSQVDVIDLSWDDDAVVESHEPSPGGGANGTRCPTDAVQSKPPPLQHSRSAQMMPPPPIPTRPAGSPAHFGLFDSPFALRPGHPPLPPSSESPVRPNAITSSTSPARPAPAGRAVAAIDSSPSVPVQRRQRRPRAHPNRVRPLLDLDAEVSGSSQSADESSGEESESDRRFANDFQPTQAPRGYDQRAMYAAGLSTQAAPRSGLNFQSAQAATSRKEAFFAKARRPMLLTDSEGSGGEENEYELGSFVCDDASVDFDTQTQSDPLSCP